MDPSARRLLIAIGLSTLVMLAWSRIMTSLYPPPPRPADDRAASSAPSSQAVAASDGTSAAPSSLGAAPGDRAAAASAPAATPYQAVAQGGPELFELGRDEPPGAKYDPQAYWLYVKLTAHGAAIESADVTPYRNHVPRGKNPPPDTYDLLRPWTNPDNQEIHNSFATPAMRLIREQADVPLAALAWHARKETTPDGERVIFQADVLRAGEPFLRLTKTYSLARGAYDLGLRLDVENLSAAPVELSLTQQGPIGMKSEDLRGYERFVMSGVKSVGAREVRTHPYDRAAVLKAEERRLELTPKAKGDVLHWVAQTNKYFTCVARPRTVAEPTPLEMVKAAAMTWSPDAQHENDLQFSLIFHPPTAVPAGGRSSAELALYLGPKDRTLFAARAEYAEQGYDAIVDATSQSCAWMTFRPLAALMRWLLASLNHMFEWLLPGEHHFGSAIIVMVLLVRLMLHGLTKRGQINMMRLQKQMARLQPKMELLKVKYAGDAQQLNREMMQLYREEGVSPFAQMSGCLPMFVQMPIWVALWSTLNSTIELRHEPFILWMRDLAAPDALISFNATYHIPLLGAMTGPIQAFNLLPLVMAATMYFQQKLTQRLTRPDPAPAAAAPSPDGRPSAADQLRQQQQIMNFMTVFFGLMFYNFPCGLNLYIFTSNVFGMLEQWRIRKHIKSIDVAAPPAKSAPAETTMLHKPKWLIWLEKKAEETRKTSSARAEAARHKSKRGARR